MKELWPKKSNELNSLNSSNSGIVTREDLDDIFVQLNVLKNADSNISSRIDQIVVDLNDAISTQVLNADQISSIRAVLTTIDATTITSQSITSDELHSDSIESAIAEISKIVAENITVNDLNATNAEIENLSVENLEITGDYNFTNITANEATIEEIGTSTLTSTKIESGEIDSDLIVAEEGNIDKLNSNEVKIADLEVLENFKSPIVDSSFFTNTTPIEIEGAEDLYIHIPLTQGQTEFALKKNEEDEWPIVDVQIFNTMDNFFIRWTDNNESQTERYLIDCYTALVEDDRSILVLHLHGLPEQVLGYFLNESLKSTDVTVYSDDWNLPDNVLDTSHYTFTYRSGNKFFKPVDGMNDAEGSIKELEGYFTDVHEDTDDVNFSYNTTRKVEKTFYRPDQGVSDFNDVGFNSLKVQEATRTTETDDEGQEVEKIEKGSIYFYAGKESDRPDLENFSNYALIIQEEQ